MSVFSLEGRRAMVTGGAQGLGQGMAEALARAGASVVVADVQDEAAQVVAKAITAAGGTASAVHLDVTDESSWASGVAQAVDVLGGLDVLVNNAGVEITSLVVDVEPADVMRMLEVNVLG